jgi:hypothetical protein
MITSGLNAWRSTRATVWVPLYLSYLARAYADIGNFEDAWRCISEAITAVGTGPYKLLMWRTPYCEKLDCFNRAVCNQHL